MPLISKMHHRNGSVIIIFLFNYVWTSAFAQNSNLIFGEDSLKFEIYRTIIEHGGSLNQLVMDCSDPAELITPQQDSRIVYELRNSKLLLVIIPKQKVVEIVSSDSVLLVVSKSNRKLIVEDYYSRNQVLIFVLKNKKIRKVKITSTNGNPGTCTAYFIRKKKVCEHEGRTEAFTLTMDERKKYQALFELYDLRLFD